ncbi:MAG: DUF6514 family protein [Defluviitaleaceae bacterium]|nr:DUF6514 family protein [Defluviitaleaceae bacterium]
MMKLIETTQLPTGCPGAATISYYMRTEISDDCEYYAIYSEMHTGDTITDKADSGPICEDEGKICSIIGILAANSVTPVSLCEILDELFDEMIA